MRRLIEWLKWLFHGQQEEPTPDVMTGRIPYVCKGGPYAGRVLWLHSPTTLEFSAGKYHGHYEEHPTNPMYLIWKDETK
jgi:hypothetical protein